MINDLLNSAVRLLLSYGKSHWFKSNSSYGNRGMVGYCYQKNCKTYGNPNILAEFIAGQLNNRVSFRKAMKKAIELTEQADTKGLQVQIAGRIDGKEIARVEWI
ncbi:hypothetical protein M9H77_14839 [Catharanthus roseus]|uniref:Uncharacterized protein n=1 Tax=Catharanthus roseus TaxID=4058 RepID=A0ACC0BPC7_CATRO|nr:hypothetical protein M9H77_14839 [Catharanthus roseus]